MCATIVINNGVKELDTPSKFRDFFGYLPEKKGGYSTPIQINECLCQCDLDKTFEQKGVYYTTDPAGDYYIDIGELNDIIY